MIHTFSERSEAILDAAGARWFQLDATTPIERWSDTIVRAHKFAHTTHRPIRPGSLLDPVADRHVCSQWGTGKVDAVLIVIL